MVSCQKRHGYKFSGFTCSGSVEKKKTMNPQEELSIRDFYFQMKAFHHDLEQHVEVTRETLSDIDGDLGLMKLLLDALSVRVKDLDQPYKEVKDHERLVPPCSFQGRFEAYQADREFMTSLQAKWGRPFWQERNGLFYCQIYNHILCRYQDIALGFDKKLVLEKIQILSQTLHAFETRMTDTILKKVVTIFLMY